VIRFDKVKMEEKLRVMLEFIKSVDEGKELGNEKLQKRAKSS